MQLFSQTFNDLPQKHVAKVSLMQECFKIIAGRDWERAKDYRNFLPTINRLNKLINGPDAKMDFYVLAALCDVMGAFSAEERGGVRARPYYHHQLMGWVVAEILGLSVDQKRAIIHHDSGEDVLPSWCREVDVEIPDDIVGDLGKKWVMRRAGEKASRWVCQLTNPEDMPNGKHATQMDMVQNKMDEEAKSLKIIDCIINLFDMKQDKPKKYTPEKIAAYLTKKHELAVAAGDAIREEQWALFAAVAHQLVKEHSLEVYFDELQAAE
jgi:hypothetical protein